MRLCDIIHSTAVGHESSPPFNLHSVGPSSCRRSTSDRVCVAANSLERSFGRCSSRRAEDRRSTWQEGTTHAVGSYRISSGDRFVPALPLCDRGSALRSALGARLMMLMMLKLHRDACRAFGGLHPTDYLSCSNRRRRIPLAHRRLKDDNEK